MGAVEMWPAGEKKSKPGGRLFSGLFWDEGK